MFVLDCLLGFRTGTPLPTSEGQTDGPPVSRQTFAPSPLPASLGGVLPVRFSHPSTPQARIIPPRGSTTTQVSTSVKVTAPGGRAAGKQRHHTTRWSLAGCCWVPGTQQAARTHTSAAHKPPPSETQASKQAGQQAGGGGGGGGGQQSRPPTRRRPREPPPQPQSSSRASCNLPPVGGSLDSKQNISFFLPKEGARREWGMIPLPLSHPRIPT